MATNSPKPKIVGEGLTYDDVLLIPAYSEVLPRDVNLASQFSRNITLITTPKGVLRVYSFGLILMGRLAR